MRGLHLAVLGAVLLQQAQSLSDYVMVDATFRLNSEGETYCSSAISTDCKEGSFSGVGYLKAGDTSYTVSLKASDNSYSVSVSNSPDGYESIQETAEERRETTPSRAPSRADARKLTRLISGRILSYYRARGIETPQETRTDARERERARGRTELGRLRAANEGTKKSPSRRLLKTPTHHERSGGSDAYYEEAERARIQAFEATRAALDAEQAKLREAVRSSSISSSSSSSSMGSSRSAPHRRHHEHVLE